ncbi:MAG: nucleotidyl transferase AbiEii/AbiGii toxin family protein, partial [Planctomycetes bacterium]|nr:nucleotidyl transferase AbiEii/AbiGii toxin family protein [Planctomycetota bacterium]
MNTDYVRIIAASDEDRRGLFAATARRIGTTEQNVEKDFWVCWTLDTLFRRRPEGGPRLLFKGGTSLSKAFGLINRMSEDIDITVFRADLGQPAPLEELEALSGKKRRARLDAIRKACRHYIHGDLRTQLAHALGDVLQAAGRRHAAAGVVADEGDPDGQTLLIHYPSAAAAL